MKYLNEYHFITTMGSSLAALDFPNRKVTGYKKKIDREVTNFNNNLKEVPLIKSLEVYLIDKKKIVAEATIHIIFRTKDTKNDFSLTNVQEEQEDSELYNWEGTMIPTTEIALVLIHTIKENIVPDFVSLSITSLQDAINLNKPVLWKIVNMIAVIDTPSNEEYRPEMYEYFLKYHHGTQQSHGKAISTIGNEFGRQTRKEQIEENSAYANIQCQRFIGFSEVQNQHFALLKKYDSYLDRLGSFLDHTKDLLDKQRLIYLAEKGTDFGTAKKIKTFLDLSIIIPQAIRFYWVNGKGFKVQVASDADIELIPIESIVFYVL